MKEAVITSRDNPKIKAAASLVSSAGERREQGLFVAEGLRLCTDAVKSGAELCEVFVTEEFRVSNPQACELVCGHAGSIFEVTQGVMKKLSDTSSPQGILAVGKQPVPGVLPRGRLLLLDRVSDPSNLGAAARTSEALGMDGLVLSENCCDPFNPKALRASMGAFFRLPMLCCGDLAAEIVGMTADGIRVFGSVVNGGEDVRNCSFESPCALVIGNEANGISQDVRSVCTGLVNIRMRGRAESLNASAAAAILMWEMMRGL